MAAFILGPDPEDLSHAYSLWRSGGFRPERSLLVLNAGVIRAGRTAAGAFDATLSSPEIEEMVAAGVKPIRVRPLAVVEKAKSNGGLYVAAEGKANLGPAHLHMVRQWLKDYETERERLGVSSWLP